VSQVFVETSPIQPVNGTLITGAQTGEGHVVADGAPIYVSTWATFGGPQPTTTVDQAAIDNAGSGGLWNHLRAMPADGTLITGAQTCGVPKLEELSRSVDQLFRCLISS
jgi:hypothetical protein